MKTITDLLENIENIGFDNILLNAVFFTTCAIIFICTLYVLKLLSLQKKLLKESAKEQAEEQAKEQFKFPEVGNKSSFKDELPDENDPPFLWETPNPMIHDFQELEERTAPCHLTRLPSYAGQIVTFEAYTGIFLSPVRFTV